MEPQALLQQLAAPLEALPAQLAAQQVAQRAAQPGAQLVAQQAAEQVAQPGARLGQPERQWAALQAAEVAL